MWEGGFRIEKRPAGPQKASSCRTRVFAAHVRLLAPPVSPKAARAPLLLRSPLSPAFVVILPFLYLTSVSHSHHEKGLQAVFGVAPMGLS